MKLGNVTISKKLGMGFGSILVLLALVSILSYTGIENVGSNAHGLILANDFNAQIDTAEKDHVKWVDQVTTLLTDDNVKTLAVETDDHKCRFGKWYYGEGRKSIETRLPSMSQILNKIADKHEKLHKSAISISENYKYEELISAVQAKEKMFPKFEEIGKNFTADLKKIMETTIDPAKAVAEAEGNIREMAKWDEIDMGMNKGMIQPFLLLRIEVASMAQNQTEAQWDICLKQLKAVEQGVADWSSLVAEKKFLNNVVENLNTHIQAFSVVMNDYIEALRAEKIARAAIDNAKKIYRETTVATLEEIRLIFSEAKSEGRKHAISEEALLGKAHRVELNVLIISIVAFIIGISLAILVARNIIRPIGSAVGFTKELAKGDLTQTMDIDQSDEIGVLVKSLNNMAQNLRTMFTEIATGTQTLKASSTELSCISEQMSTNSEQTAEKSNNVATSAEEMTTNMNGVAAATEQASVNIQMIVSATEEMSSTISEIAGNTAKGSETTNKAVEAAKEVSQKVDELGRAASEINKVTETIADISEQTNLLALNATIEAARAGEAGKGFAVVAGEIKALAQQTAEATSEISDRIARVQKTTKESVSAIDSIVAIINEINQIVTTVAAAIEEQSATTQEIANNVTQAAQGIQEVNQNVGQTSSVAGEVTKDIAEVSQAASEMNNGSRQVKTSAEALTQLAEQLNEMVGRFEI